MNGIIRTYSELMRIESYEERFEYLALNGTVARPTFGNERWMNQRFYHRKNGMMFEIMSSLETMVLI